MGHNEFWEVIKDDATKTFEVVGLSTNDTFITKLTCEMQETGLEVRCETVPATTPKHEILREFIAIGYKPENGLFNRLKAELRAMTQRANNS
jgi:hypothetical protein